MRPGRNARDLKQGREPQSRGRRRLVPLLVGAGLGVISLAPVQPAGAVECPLQMLFLRMCGTLPPPPVTTPTTVATVVAPPSVTLPPVTVPPVVAPTPTMTPLEAALRLLDLTNDERRRAGLGTVTRRDDVTAIAVAHSERMARAGDIFHSDTFLTPGVKALLNAGARGENVAYNGSIDSAHARLMASPGHRANILDGRFSVAGFGVVRHADGRWFITQNFIQPLGAPSSAAPRTVPRSAAPATATAPRAAAPAPPPTTVTAPPPVEVAVEVGASPVVASEPEPTQAVLAAAEPAPASIRLQTRSAGVVRPLAVAGAALLGLAVMACWLLARRPHNG